MPVSIDPITRKKLILVKQLYHQAVVQSASQHNAMSRILSVIGFDLAIETALRGVVGSLDASKTPADGFQGLIQQCDNLLPNAGCGLIPDKANIQYVHSIRNDAQHKAKYPNESDVSDCRTYCRDFLQKVITDIWGLDFEKISLTDIIQDNTVKQLLTSAETTLGQRDYEQAIQLAAAGLTRALSCVEPAFVGRLPSFVDGIMLLDSFRQPASDFDARTAYRALERIQETLLYIALGMNYSDYMKFKQIVGHVYFTLDGKHHHHGGKVHPDANDAEFVVAYCAESVLQIENRVGSLKAPFGSEHWY